jgi:hypothetical protein
MKRFSHTTVIVLLCVLFGVSPAPGQTASFTYSGVPVGAVASGSSFTININLVFTAGGSIMDLNGLSYWMAQQGGTAFPFTITNRTTTGLFAELQSSGLTYPQTIDPISRNANGTFTSTDFGALSVNPQPNGTYPIASLTFSVGNAAAGNYVIGNTTSLTPGVGGRSSIVNDSEGDTFAIASSTFSVAVVPEPSSVAFLCLGLMSAVAFAYRRRRALPRA